MLDIPVKENGLWILLAAVGLWIATFTFLFAFSRNSSGPLPGGPLRKLALTLVLFLSILILGDAFFGLDWSIFTPWIGILAVLIGIGTGILSRFDRMSRVWVGFSLLAWYMSLIVLTLEGVMGTFLVSPLVPNNQRRFQEEIVEWWPYEIEERKDPDTFRILALGDSFGRAHEEDNYHFLVHQAFLENGVKAKILNVSVSGIEPTDQLKLLQLFGDPYQPDLVLQNFFVGNDFFVPPGEFVYFGGIYIRHYEGLLGCIPKNFLLVNWIKTRWKVLTDQTRRDGEAKIGEKVGSFSRDSFLQIEYDRLVSVCSRGPDTQQYLDTALPVLEEIRLVADVIGADYAIMVLPDQFQVDQTLFEEILSTFSPPREELDLDLPQNRLRSYCQEREIPVLDLLPYFRQSNRGDDLFLLRDTHYNEAGNALVADALYQFLVENWDLAQEISFPDTEPPAEQQPKP